MFDGVGRVVCCVKCRMHVYNVILYERPKRKCVEEGWSKRKNIPIPGLEPGFPAWKASVITTYTIPDDVTSTFCNYMYNAYFTCSCTLIYSSFTFSTLYPATRYNTLITTYLHTNIILLALTLKFYIMPAQHTFHYRFTFYTKVLLGVANVACQ